METLLSKYILVSWRLWKSGILYFQTVQKIPAVLWSEVTHLWTESTGRSRIHRAVAVPEPRTIIGQGSVVPRQFLKLLLRDFFFDFLAFRNSFSKKRPGISSHKGTPFTQGCLISQNVSVHIPLFLSMQSVQKELSWRLHPGVVSGWLFSNTGEGVSAGLSYAPYSNVGSSFG